MSAIFWTLGYDTIYGAQDMSDDEIIGLKSTSIKFKKNIKLFVGICYLLCFSLLFLLFFEDIGFNLFTLLFFMFIFSLISQLKLFDKKKPSSCLTAFKFNNLAGIFLFVSIYLL